MRFNKPSKLDVRFIPETWQLLRGTAEVTYSADSYGAILVIHLISHDLNRTMESR